MNILLFPLGQLPPMTKGQGVALQKFKDGGMSDIKVFKKSEGLTWGLGNKTRTETNLTEWLGNRADRGKLPPNGFPRSNRFD